MEDPSQHLELADADGDADHVRQTASPRVWRGCGQGLRLRETHSRDFNSGIPPVQTAAEGSAVMQSLLHLCSGNISANDLSA